MDEHINNISNRLSLRKPQQDSLNILADLTARIPLAKEPDLKEALESIAANYPSVTDFERDFPSLCFALATGVGKTRLMGAFISYLRLAKGIRHFFVLAPNLTIYDKLIADFTPGTAKYVFKGISEFAINPPELITGDNYESGRGLRGVDFFERTESIHINIFNISKINSEVRGGRSPRIKRLSEYIGQSYFDYLAGLEDLVLLMDESHRYRASAGVRAINDLKPVLGLELTATPQVESGNQPTEFKNIIYNYPLSQAMEDGYVKEPAVATRENFNAGNYTDDQLEQLKLIDGIHIHEAVKTELKLYADNHDKPYVKPFMLVVAQDISHAEKLKEIIERDDFYEGEYKEKVITVHSTQSREEKDETVERLLAVENPEEPTEIVIHVNMLKEGWDVNNLYTIVPLRAANSRTLVEQSIGRGLRLPFGRRTGVAVVDRLTIVAHDRFDEIIRDAHGRESVIRKTVTLGKDSDYQSKKALEIRPNLESRIIDEIEEKEATPTVLEVIKEFESLPSSKKLQEESVQEKIAERAEARGKIENLDYKEVTKKVVEIYLNNTIDIPYIRVTPKTPQNYSFRPFELDTSTIGNPKPVSRDILIQHLRTAESEQMESDDVTFEVKRPEDYIIAALTDFNDISYEHHAEILHNLANQMVTHIRSYLNDKDEILNVLQYHCKDMAGKIHNQMQQYYQPGHSENEIIIARGFTRPKVASVSYDAEEKPRYFRDNVEERPRIRGMLFNGFKKCLYPIQKFDSDTEREFAMLLEHDASVQKWFKPLRADFKIPYTAEHTYEPDFVVETSKYKLLCEPKMERDVESQEVREKAAAARKWCAMASEHELQHGGKCWIYLLIPHVNIKPSATINGLIAQFGG